MGGNRSVTAAVGREVEDGGARDDNRGMIRKSFIMSVNKGSEAEYERRHRPIWDDLAKTLTSHGVHNYSIFLDPQTNLLFAYLEIEDEARWKQIAQTEVCKRWWAHMREVMPSNPDNSPISREAREVFHQD
jgi:L-rhamnose mutarotase